jgi:hypothetical protein
MAQLATRFDATAFDTEQQDYELLPTGNYRLEVSASDIKYEGRNSTLSLTYDVIEPEEYAKRKIFAYIDLENDDAKKQEDGQRDFAKLCRAVEKTDVENSEELHFIAFTARVENASAGVSKAGRPYKAKNRIKKFFYSTDIKGNPVEIPEPSIDANQPAPAPKAANDNKPAAATKAPTAQAAAGGQRRPWGQK